MDCKKVLASLLIVTISIYSGSKASSQNCFVYKTPYKAFGFDSSGLVSSKYDDIKKNDSDLYQIYFVTTSGKKAKAYYLSIDSFNNVHACYLTESFKKRVNTLRLDNKELNVYRTLKWSDTLSGYYLSTCKNVLSWSFNETLVIKNPKGKWLEYTSIDGHMIDALKENNEYQYLLVVLNMLQKILPGFKVGL